MKLLLDIDEGLFDAVRKLTKAKTKKEAIVISMQEYLRNHKKAELVQRLHGYKHGMTLKQLFKFRNTWKKS